MDGRSGLSLGPAPLAWCTLSFLLLRRPHKLVSGSVAHITSLFCRFRGKYKGQWVAVKEMSLDSPQAFEEFKKEVALLFGLHHPHVVSCYGGTVLKKVVRLVAELMEVRVVEVEAETFALHGVVYVGESIYCHRWRCLCRCKQTDGGDGAGGADGGDGGRGGG